LVLFFIVALLIGGAKTCTALTGRPNPLDIALTTITTPVVAVIKNIGEGIASLRHIFRIPSMLRENADLTAENELLERRSAELQFTRAENERLRALLALDPPPGFTPLTARVIARPYDLWLESALISAGSSRGVRAGDLVVNDAGVVGVVEEVQPTYSRMVLISSPEFKLGALTMDHRVEGVITGVDARYLKLDLVPAGSLVEVGEKVFTLGQQDLGGGEADRPRGVYIGMIIRREEDRSGFLRITVEPAANASRLGNVVVYTR
jgi:rod shape-determining protein MreC